MTEKEAKAIEYLKHTLKISDELFEEVGDRLIDTSSSLQIETVLNLIEKQKAEIEKKDKIIDELEDIFYNYQLCDYELTDCTYRKCEYIADDEIPPCKECIKQYFEREVENGRNKE